jgi:hypothetical protein
VISLILQNRNFRYLWLANVCFQLGTHICQISLIFNLLVPYYSLIQDIVQEQFLGRIFSIARQIEQIALLLVVCSAMLLSQSIGSHRIFLLGGLLYFSLVTASILTRNGKNLLLIK